MQLLLSSDQLRVLLALFGNLQAVWNDAELQALLLGLPLPAMQLLLSSDQLRVPSEDTVLYTAKQYEQAQTDDADAAAAKAALAQLVCTPQLSPLALSCAAQPADSNRQLLGSFVEQLRALLPLKRIASAEQLTAALQAFHGAPASWRLSPRHALPGRLLSDGVQLEWRLPVKQLEEACRESYAGRDAVQLISPSSAPLGGVAWRMKAVCGQRGRGTLIGLFVGPVRVEVPASIFYKFTYSVSWQGVQHTSSSSCVSNSQSWGYPNFFQLQPMTKGGWDAAAWAAAGLPAGGEMLLQLHVRSVE
jgi:hypothetical protein